MDQMATVLSLLAEASQREQGEKCTALTVPVWYLVRARIRVMVRVRVRVRVWVSARVVPQHREWLPLAPLPHADPPVPAAGGEQLGVGPHADLPQQVRVGVRVSHGRYSQAIVNVM